MEYGNIFIFRAYKFKKEKKFVNMNEPDNIDELFKMADKSKDKEVSIKELDKIFDQLGLQLKLKDVKKIIQKYDNNNDKHLNKEEFRALINDIYQSEK